MGFSLVYCCFHILLHVPADVNENDGDGVGDSDDGNDGGAVTGFAEAALTATPPPAPVLTRLLNDMISKVRVVFRRRGHALVRVSLASVMSYSLAVWCLLSKPAISDRSVDDVFRWCAVPGVVVRRRFGGHVPDHQRWYPAQLCRRPRNSGTALCVFVCLYVRAFVSVWVLMGLYVSVFVSVFL